VTFFSVATWLGFFVMLAGTLVAYRGGSGLSDAVVRGAIGFGVVLVLGYLADMLVFSAPLRMPERQQRPAAPGAVTRAVEARPSTAHEADDSEQLAA
jgi:hypothetical protein